MEERSGELEFRRGHGCARGHGKCHTGSVPGEDREGFSLRGTLQLRQEFSEKNPQAFTSDLEMQSSEAYCPDTEYVDRVCAHTHAQTCAQRMVS